MPREEPPPLTHWLERYLRAGMYPAAAARKVGCTRQNAWLVAKRLKAQGVEIAVGPKRPASERVLRIRARADISRRARGLREAQVKALALLGMNAGQIAAVLEISSRGYVAEIMRRPLYRRGQPPGVVLPASGQGEVIAGAQA